MSWTAITTRVNGLRVDKDWFNAIKTAVDEITGFLGAGGITETQFTIADNTGPSNVTGLVFAAASYRGAIVKYTLYRKSDTEEFARCGTLHLVYKTTANTWELEDSGAGDAGVTFTVTAAGQVQYTSSNMSNSGYAGYMRFKAETISKES